MYKMIWSSIRDVVLSFDELDPSFLAKFESETAPSDECDLYTVLKDLMKKLYKVYGKPSVVIIDEYDTPMNHAYLNGYFNQATQFFSIFYGAAFKSTDDTMLKKVCFLGIVEIKCAGILSGMNNAVVYCSRNEEFSDCFGFYTRKFLNTLEM